MGKMKDLGQQLSEKLNWLYEEERKKLEKQILSGAYQHGSYGGQVSVNQRSQIVSNMRGVDDPNKREAYAIPLSRLADMWRIKFEDKWVDVSELDEEFWADASGRLHRNKLMEEVEFNGSNTPWARLKENA